MRRIPDVLDCWFESGSMPFAQLHYPFENDERFEEHFPADFIVEYVGQTRGWFYTLHVLGDGAVRPAAVSRPASRTASCSATTAASSPSGCATSPTPRRSSPPTGADAMRWYLLSSPVLRGHDVVIEEKGARRAGPPGAATRSGTPGTSCPSTRNADGIARARAAPTRPGVLDRYVLAKTRRLVEDVTAAMDAYDLAGATGRHLRRSSTR